MHTDDEITVQFFPTCFSSFSLANIIEESKKNLKASILFIYLLMYFVLFGTRATSESERRIFFSYFHMAKMLIEKKIIKHVVDWLI